MVTDAEQERAAGTAGGDDVEGVLAKDGGFSDVDAEAEAGGLDGEDFGGCTWLVEENGLGAVEVFAQDLGFESGAGLRAHRIDGGGDGQAMLDGVGTQGDGERQGEK